jgi:DNA (cytosine-5)-methyltransferase 3A
MGWELFSQFVRALKEAKPKYFVYENNKSMSKAIRKSIDGAFGFDAVLINSALVSAQNRQRLYWVGKRNLDGTYSRVKVEQPADRGILLRDVLDGVTDREKGRCVLSSIGRTTTREYFKKDQGTMAFEPCRIPEYGAEDKARPLGANYSNNCGGFEHRMFSDNPNKQRVDMVAQPVGIGYRGRMEDGKWAKRYESNEEPKANALTTCQTDSMCACRVGALPRPNSELCGVFGYATPCEWDEDGRVTKAISGADGKVYTVYEVNDGQITIKDKQYPIKLADGFYIIRKLTVSECKRLQTVPEWYEFPVSDTQAYKMLGNGWTVEVIAHLINATQADEMEEEQLDLFRQGVV